MLRGTAQNPDVYFQARETVNPYYLACPDDRAERHGPVRPASTGRPYHLFDYVGAPDAERVIVLMGSGAEAAEETVEDLVRRGEKVGVLKVRLYRPFSVEHFLAALPPTVRALAVLDRTKEPGSIGEPLYLDVRDRGARGALRRPGRLRHQSARSSAAATACRPRNSRRPWSRQSSTSWPKTRPQNHFTVGIHDDVTHTSLDYDPAFSTEDPATVRAVFYGLGSDGTVGANKNSIKIIGEETDFYAQGYFVYDSKKSGFDDRLAPALRPAADPLHLPDQPGELRGLPPVRLPGTARRARRSPTRGPRSCSTAPTRPTRSGTSCRATVQETIIAKKLRFFVIDAYRVAREAGMGERINTIMQTCFFAISGVLPRDEAIAAIKKAIEKTYGKRGEAVVQKNFAAVDATLSHLDEVPVPDQVTQHAPAAPTGAAGRPGVRPAGDRA